MNYFKCGDRVELVFKEVDTYQFDFSHETGIVVGYATLQSGCPCVVLSMDGPDSNGVRHNRLVVPMAHVAPVI